MKIQAISGRMKMRIKLLQGRTIVFVYNLYICFKLQRYQNIRGKSKRHGDRDESIFPLYILYPLWPFSLSFEIYDKS